MRSPLNASQPRRATGRPPGLGLDASLLRARRQALGLSQEALALRAGVASRTLQNAERGARVSRDVGAAIAIALGIELADLALDLDLDRVTGARLAERLVEGGFAPPPPIAAIGRDVERAWLRERFGASGSVCIVGPPGAGKSALAADLVASMPGTGPVCWLDGARIERSDPVTVLFALASCLGLSERLPNANLVPLDALARAFRKALWRLSPTLVLDDVSAPDSITLLADLDAAPRLVVTTSSRVVARGLAVPCLELGPLSTADALDILAMSARPSASDAGAPLDAAELEAAHELIALVGRSPRVLRVVGHQLARDAFSRLPDYLDRLKGALATRPESPRARAAATDLEPAFLATWLGLDGRLPQSALEALGALAIFERRRVPLAWALAAIGGEPSEARASLSRLHDLHLVTRLGPDTLGLDADAQRIARTLPAGPALDRLVAYAIPRLDAAARSSAELSLCMLLFDASCDALFPDDPITPASLSPEGPPPLDPARRPHASLLVALGLPLLPALVQDHAPVAGRRLAALARAASSVAEESLADVAGALGTWLLTCAGQPHAALPWLERAIALSVARGDPRSAGRFAAQRAPAGYYLGDPEQGLGDIRRAITFADAAGDVDAARASSLMHAIGIAHMRDAWPEAIAELRACTTPVQSAHGAVLAALARVDLAVCELALGLPISHPDALGSAFDELAQPAQGSPFDLAGVEALAIVLGVRARPALDPAGIVSTMLEAVDDAHLASTFLRLDILADAFSAHLFPSPSRPAFAARRGTAAVPFLPGSLLQAAIGHHLPLMVPLEPFRFLLSPPVLEAAIDLVADHVGDGHPLPAKLAALTSSAPSLG